MTVEIASPPPLERIRPHTDLARVTLTAVVGEESGVAPLTAVLGLKEPAGA